MWELEQERYNSDWNKINGSILTLYGCVGPKFNPQHQKKKKKKCNQH